MTLGMLSIGLGSFSAMAADDRLPVIEFLAGVINDLNALVFSSFHMFGADINWIVVWMAAPMLVLTVYFGFINLRSFKQASRILRGHYENKNARGEVSQFQALSTALSGTVGLGNIAGVAVAISIGGPGATFWMIIIGFCAMSLKFAECTLAVKYRVYHDDGTVSGGPMYFLENGLKDWGPKWGKFGKYLAWTYAILALPTILQIAQVNQAYEAVDVVAGFEGDAWKWGFGIFAAAVTALVIIGGIKSIAKVTVWLVPSMSVIYILAALTIILSHIGDVPAAFGTIFDGAFSPDGVTGGIVGVIIIGMKRAVYSSEAGLGSAAMAHAAAKTDEPISEGLVALMEPFIDTVIVCTMTALVIVITGQYEVGADVQGISMTSKAFGSVISWFPWVLAFAAFLFALSTILSWGYYSGKIWGFLFGRSKISMGSFNIVYCLLLIPGAVLSPQEVYDLMDALFFMLAVPNIIGIFLMAPMLKRDLKSYKARIKSGDIKNVKGIST